MKMVDQVKLVATETNALAYDATDDKFVFCINLLEISAHWGRSDFWVEHLEDIFEEMLDPTAQEDSGLPDDAW